MESRAAVRRRSSGSRLFRFDRGFGLRWVAGGKKLLSVGQAPKLRGYLATWDPATGKLLSGKELTHGSVFALAVSADEKFIALGTGGSVRTGEELNLGVVLKMPE